MPFHFKAASWFTCCRDCSVVPPPTICTQSSEEPQGPAWRSCPTSSLACTGTRYASGSSHACSQFTD
eukprot:3296003-Rhodomonas_salina.1